MGRRYITTAIPYVNAQPHLGFALELVQADVLARHGRLRGTPVRFLTGTDDNALKNVIAARAAGVDVRSFVDTNAQRFTDLREPLQLSFDDFIRTSADPRHKAGVARLWSDCAARGDFYQRHYTGRYCGGCEQFYTPGELPGGRCPEHGTEPKQVSETNWFFRLSNYRDELLEVLESGRVRIEPAPRRNEILAFLRGGVGDISVSRPAARSGGWGLPVPGDPDQVIYVWWDALGNYVTALDYGTGGSAYRDWWCESTERVHVIGKGIVRFHAVYWLALLLSAGAPLPTTILVHDYLTVNGAKISKSAGRSVDPLDLVDRYGADAVRWWLLNDVARGADTDFTVPRLLDRANTDLANGIGNLTHRSVTLVRKYRPAGVPQVAVAGSFITAARGLPGRIDDNLRVGDFRAATAAIRAAVDQGNQFVETQRPWEVRREEVNGQPSAGARLDAILAELVAGCRAIARELAAFLPAGAQRLQEQLDGSAPAGPAFPRIEEDPARPA